MFVGCSMSTLIAQQSEKDTTYVLSPVIVTATQAKERETPVTFSDLNREQIRDRYNVQDVPVLLSELPSITFYSENGNGIGYSYINLRGFDQRRLSVMINGVPQNDPEDHNIYWIDFPDLLASASSIQVQRGAGSAFYGPPAIGGSVNLVTNPFTNAPGVTMETTFGFQQFSDSSRSLPLNTRKYDISINSGLINQRYMLYSRIGKLTSEGYRLNSWVDLSSYFLGAIRFDHNMSTRFHLFGGPFADGLSYYGLPKFVNSSPVLRRQNPSENGWALGPGDTSYSYFAPRRPQESESFSQPHYEIINDWQFSPSMHLSNTIFYYSGEGYYDYDGSWIPYDANALNWFRTYVGYDSTLGTSVFPSFLIRAFVGNKQWGWLPHVEIDHGNGIVTVGAELRIHRSTHWGKIQFAEILPSGIDPDFHIYEYNGEKDILSFYVHELYRPEERLTLVGDLQLIRNRYAIANEKFLGNDFSLAYFFVNPRVGINYNFTDVWNGYVSAAYTSREPKLTDLYPAEFAYDGETPQFQYDTTNGKRVYDFTRPFARPERLLDLEVGAGFKSSSSQFSADVFWMEFTDELVKSGNVDLFGQPVVGNADRTRHVGLEVEGRFLLTNALSISGNLGLSHNRLVHYSVIDDNGTRVVLDGNPIAGFPDFLGNLRLTFSSGPVTASTVVKYVGPFYVDNFKTEEGKNNDYTTVNADVMYKLPRIAGSDLMLRGEVDNLLNRLYFRSGDKAWFGYEFFPAAERNLVVGITANL